MALLRIVRMHFREDRLGDFLTLFNHTVPQIKAFPGCINVSLLQDPDQPEVLYTFSKWESQQALEAYRASTLFENTWEATKKLFKDKPAAYSMVPLDFSIS